MKTNLMYFLLFLFVGTIFTSCKKEDDEPVIIDNPVYGMQVSGTATGDQVLVIDAKQVVEPSSDFAVKAERDGMLYGIHFLKAGEISFKEVLADSEVAYGLSDVATVTQEEETGEAFTYSKGKLVADGTGTFTIDADGLYYIMTDNETKMFWVMRINNFEINATGDKIAYVSGSAETATFEAKGVDIRAKFKLRMNTAWKFIAEDVEWLDLDAGGAEGDHCRPVISYGGTIDALLPEGDDIEVDNGGKLLDFTFTWTSGKKGIVGFSGAVEQAGDLPPAEYPENLYMIGGTIGGWDWEANAIEMVPVHSNPHLFWKIVWMEAGVADEGVKFAPEKAWGKDFGVDGDPVEGVYAKGTDNIPGPAESGYFMVVVNLKEETIEVNAPMVYGIGDTFGSWDAADEANLFTVDNANELIKFENVPNAGELRMHVAAATMTNEEGNAVDWWQAEFMVLNELIEYRGAGGDQDRVILVGGETINLKFKDDTGSIN